MKKWWKLNNGSLKNHRVTCSMLDGQNGRIVATGLENGRIDVWSLPKCENVITLNGMKSEISALQFGRNERYLGAGSVSGKLNIWNLSLPTNQMCISSITLHRSAINVIVFSKLIDLVACGSSDTAISLWHIKNKKLIAKKRFPLMDVVTQMEFSPDEKLLTIGDDKGKII
ncbi:hypothetical protein SNEBB_004548, partial [Seison nebaliae]